MLLYSAKFPVKETMTREIFIELVIRWNQGSPYDKIEGLEWDHETKNIVFKDHEKRSLSIEELRKDDIVAARFRKDDENGIRWTSDFIFNHKESMLSVRLEREATEDTTMFSYHRANPPYFVKMVIDEGFSAMDKDIEVSSKAVKIDETNCNIIKKIVFREAKYMLPIIYISKMWNGEYLLEPDKIASQVQGIAHVMKETDSKISCTLKESCKNQNVYNGGIGIYFPGISAKPKKFNPLLFRDRENLLRKKIIESVYRYTNQQAQEPLYTWDGIQNRILKLKYESLAQKKDEIKNENREMEEMWQKYIDQIAELNERLEDLGNEKRKLEQENEGLHNKLENMDNIPIISFGQETEMYEGEIREVVLDILQDSLKLEKGFTRRKDILQDIFENNQFDETVKKKEVEIKRILKGYSTMTGTLRKNLQNFGFEISADGKHYKLLYYGDSRYVITMAKSASDNRGGGNLASEVIKKTL